MCLEKISVSIYNIKPHNFQTITWATSRMFNYLLGARQDSFEGELVSEGFVGRGAKEHVCMLLCCKGSAWHKNSTSVWLITYNLERLQNSHNVQSHLCLIFGDFCYFAKTILLQTSQCLSLYFFLWCCLYSNPYLIIL